MASSKAQSFRDLKICSVCHFATHSGIRGKAKSPRHQGRRFVAARLKKAARVKRNARRRVRVRNNRDGFFPPKKRTVRNFEKAKASRLAGVCSHVCIHACLNARAAKLRARHRASALAGSPLLARLHARRQGERSTEHDTARFSWQKAQNNTKEQHA